MGGWGEGICHNKASRRKKRGRQSYDALMTTRDGNASTTSLRVFNTTRLPYFLSTIGVSLSFSLSVISVSVPLSFSFSFSLCLSFSLSQHTLPPSFLFLSLSSLIFSKVLPFVE